MKLNNKITKGLLLILFTFFGMAESNAQVTFRPGIRAGANFSHFTKDDDFNDSNSNMDFKSKTAFYAGFYGALKLTKYYTLQPEIDYSSQGSKNADDKSFNIDYLSFEVINKFTFNDKFNIHLGPTLDFVVSKNFNNQSDVDLAFILGAGFQITPNFGIEARVKKGIIPVVDYNTYRTNVVFSVGGTYTFDLK